MSRKFIAALALATALATPIAAQSLLPGEILSSLAIRPISTPNPVPGADGKIHLAYEILVSNPSRLFMTLDKVEVVSRDGAPVLSLEGDRLKSMILFYGGADRTISPGSTAVIFLDVAFAADATLPDELLTRVTTTRQAEGPDGKPAPLPADAPVPATITFTGAATGIGAPAVVVDSPLRGKGWIAANGCCDGITAHRGAVMAVNGEIRVPERFAIDWVQIDSSNKLLTGPGDKLESYPYYGDTIYSAAAGKVVNVYDEAPEQTPGKITGINTLNIGGNMIVVDIGGGNFAFYAHLRKGSLKVKLGQEVKAGEPLALLGNTGNTDAPHLHFHVMDGPSPLDANGLPYVFRSFTTRGTLPAGSDEKLLGGEVVTIEPLNVGTHVNQLPLNNEVVDFP